MAYPKKLSAYMAYSNANRDEVKRELIASGVEKPSIAEIARAISLKWNAMSDEVKAVRERRRFSARDATRRRGNAREDETNDDAMRWFDRRVENLKFEATPRFAED